MMFITRSLIAALVIIGTVALSLGASFGLAVLLWQDILGSPLYWIVQALAVILLLAVGSDYNLLLIQVGTTIGLGLLFDTLIVRSFMTPAIAALLGRWFWWPQRVRPRPASQMLRPHGSRPAVRELLNR